MPELCLKRRTFMRELYKQFKRFSNLINRSLSLDNFFYRDRVARRRFHFTPTLNYNSTIISQNLSQMQILTYTEMKNAKIKNGFKSILIAIITCLLFVTVNVKAQVTTIGGSGLA